MSTKTSHGNKDRSRDTEFKPIDAPVIFERDDLADLRTPTDIEDADGPLAFAVASRHGLVQDFAAETELEAHLVLYLTADGEYAVEKQVVGSAGDFSSIDRVIVADCEKLTPTAGFAKRVAPAVRRHPEVAE